MWTSQQNVGAPENPPKVIFLSSISQNLDQMPQWAKSVLFEGCTGYLFHQSLLNELRTGVEEAIGDAIGEQGPFYGQFGTKEVHWFEVLRGEENKIYLVERRERNEVEDDVEENRERETLKMLLVVMVKKLTSFPKRNIINHNLWHIIYSSRTKICMRGSWVID